jgi:NADH-quinone oxidoreductase subunit H
MTVTLFLESIYQLVVIFISGILVIICILLCVAFFIVFERKLLSSTQQRVGPNTVGFLGLLQSIADAIKMLAKEMIIPLRATRKIFLIAPQILFILSLVS